MALGTKRSASLFAANAEKRDTLEFHDSPELDVVPVVVDDTPQRTLNTDASTVGRAHNLFFTPETEGKDFCHGKCEGYVIMKCCWVMITILIRLKVS